MSRFGDRVRGDALALLVWGVATCSSCKSSAQEVRYAPVLPDGSYVAPKPEKLITWYDFLPQPGVDFPMLRQENLVRYTYGGVFK